MVLPLNVRMVGDELVHHPVTGALPILAGVNNDDLFRWSGLLGSEAQAFHEHPRSLVGSDDQRPSETAGWGLPRGRLRGANGGGLTQGIVVRLAWELSELCDGTEGPATTTLHRLVFSIDLSRILILIEQSLSPIRRPIINYNQLPAHLHLTPYRLNRRLEVAGRHNRREKRRISVNPH
jgi:hypothetical protein